MNVTDSLRDWLYSLPVGTPSRPVVVQFTENGCYQVDGSLYLRNFRDYVFDGNGAIFRQRSLSADTIQGFDPASMPYCGSVYSNGTKGLVKHSRISPIMWWFEGGCDLVVENLTIEGPNTGGGAGPNSGGGKEVDSAIQLNGVQRALVGGTKIQGVDGDFVTISGLHEATGSGSQFPSTDITINSNNFNTSGRQGITPIYVDRVLISHNFLTRVGATMFDMESDVAGGCSCNIEVTDNTISGGFPYLLASLSGASLTNFAFVDNHLINGAEMKVQITAASSNISISHNTGQKGSTWLFPSISLDSGPHGTSRSTTRNVEVMNNIIPYSTSGHPFVYAGANSSLVAVRDNYLLATGGVVPLSGGSPTVGYSCGNTRARSDPPVDGVCRGGYLAPTQPQPPAQPKLSVS